MTKQEFLNKLNLKELAVVLSLLPTFIAEEYITDWLNGLRTR